MLLKSSRNSTPLLVSVNKETNLSFIVVNFLLNTFTLDDMNIKPIQTNTWHSVVTESLPQSEWRQPTMRECVDRLGGKVPSCCSSLSPSWASLWRSSMYLGLLDSMKTFSWISGGAGVLSSSPCLATASERTERGLIRLYSRSALRWSNEGPADLMASEIEVNTFKEQGCTRMRTHVWCHYDIILLLIWPRWL